MNARNCYGVGTVGMTSTRMMLGLYVPYHYCAGYVRRVTHDEIADAVG